MATSKAMPTQRVSSAAAATPTQHVSSAAAASETEFSIRSELEHVGPERSRLHSKKSKMQHPWHVQQQQMSHVPEDDDFEVTPGGASSSSAGVVFGGGPLVPPLPRFGTAAKATQAFLAREPQSPANVPPPAAAQRLSRIYDTDDGVHDVPQGHDPILRLGLAYC